MKRGIIRSPTSEGLNIKQFLSRESEGIIILLFFEIHSKLFNILNNNVQKVYLTLFVLTRFLNLVEDYVQKIIAG